MRLLAGLALLCLSFSAPAQPAGLSEQALRREFADRRVSFAHMLSEHEFVGLVVQRNRYFSGGFWGRLVVGDLRREDVTPIARMNDVKLFAAAWNGDRTWVAVRRFHDRRPRIATWAAGQRRPDLGPRLDILMTNDGAQHLAFQDGLVLLSVEQTSPRTGCRLEVQVLQLSSETLAPYDAHRACLGEEIFLYGRPEIRADGENAWIALARSARDNRAERSWRILLSADGLTVAATETSLAGQ